MEDPDSARLLSPNWFQFFTAVSVQLTVGVPLILYAKSLGASSIVLGIMAASLPMLNIIQIPAAKYLEHQGYRQFSLMAWRPRLVLTFGIALIPAFVFLGPVGKIALLLIVLLALNLLRCFSATAWMPWMTALVPLEGRGRFLSRNYIFFVCGNFFSLMVAWFIMAGSEANWKYSLVFLTGAATTLVSFRFLKQIPEVEPISTTGKVSSERVPWGAMVRYRPFLELLVFNLVCMGTIGSIDVFRLEFLRDERQFSASTLLFLASFSHIGAMIALPFTGRALDRAGSKPMLRSATAFYAGSCMLWFLVAGGVLSCPIWGAASLFICTGAAWALFSVASGRILMGTIPEMGRNHFFALYAVIIGLGTGVSPVVWGIVLDALRGFHLVMGPFQWKRHSIYFFGLLLLNLIAFFLIRRLHDRVSDARAVASKTPGLSPEAAGSR